MIYLVLAWLMLALYMPAAAYAYLRCVVPGFFSRRIGIRLVVGWAVTEVVAIGLCVVLSVRLLPLHGLAIAAVVILNFRRLQLHINMAVVGGSIEIRVDELRSLVSLLALEYPRTHISLVRVEEHTHQVMLKVRSRQLALCRLLDNTVDGLFASMLPDTHLPDADPARFNRAEVHNDLSKLRWHVYY
jgi:hypothetical protein